MIIGSSLRSKRLLGWQASGNLALPNALNMILSSKLALGFYQLISLSPRPHKCALTDIQDLCHCTSKIGLPIELAALRLICHLDHAPFVFGRFGRVQLYHVSMSE
jgi:hypothetical protein